MGRGIIKYRVGAAIVQGGSDDWGGEVLSSIALVLLQGVLLQGVPEATYFFFMDAGMSSCHFSP